MEKTTAQVFEELLFNTIGPRVSGWDLFTRNNRDGSRSRAVYFYNSQDDEFVVTIHMSNHFHLEIEPVACARTKPFNSPLTIHRDFESIGELLVFLREWT